MASLGFLWGDFGFAFVPLGWHWAQFNFLWGPMGQIFNSFGSSGMILGFLWVPFGSLLHPVGGLGPGLGQGEILMLVGREKYRVECTKSLFGTLQRIPSASVEIRRIGRNQSDVVATSAPQTLPSTRAGGQDDVSSRQSPSNEDCCQVEW